jgi:cytochrome o ubiquinol oxidase subunit IV
MHEKLTIKPYIIGFVLSLVLTFGAYFVVDLRQQLPITTELVITSILVLAVLQLLVQLFFFLHMGQEKKPRWNMVVFLSFIGLILLIVISSIWIMYHLNYNMVPQDMEKKILNDEHMEVPGYSAIKKQNDMQKYR